MSLLLPPPILETLYNQGNDFDSEERIDTNDFLLDENETTLRCRFYNYENCHEMIFNSHLKWVLVSLFILFFVIGMVLSAFQSQSVLGTVFLIISSILIFIILLWIIAQSYFENENFENENFENEND